MGICGVWTEHIGRRWGGECAKVPTQASRHIITMNLRTLSNKRMQRSRRGRRQYETHNTKCKQTKGHMQAYIAGTNSRIRHQYIEQCTNCAWTTTQTHPAKEWRPNSVGNECETQAESLNSCGGIKIGWIQIDPRNWTGGWSPPTCKQKKQKELMSIRMGNHFVAMATATELAKPTRPCTLNGDRLRGANEGMSARTP